MLIFLLLLLPTLLESAAVQSLECGACSMLVTHFESKIGAVDPKKTVEVGSFRVSPTGEQLGLEKIPFARSELHLSEIAENACDQAKQYKLVVNTITGKSVYVHKDATYLKGDETPKMRSRLQNACNDFIDSYEDDLLTFLKSEHAEPVKAFCHDDLTVCSAVDVAALPPNEPEREEPQTLADIPRDEMNTEL